MNNIYLYWVGNDYKLIKILRSLIYMHSTNGKGYKVNLINDKNIDKYIKNIPKNFYKLNPANQADFVRVNVLCDLGGIWLDSDTLVIDKLDELFEMINTKDGFLIKEDSILCNGVFGSKPNTNLMIEWKKRILTRLNIDGDINWTEIGNSMLEDIKITTPDHFKNYHIYSGINDLYPIIWNNSVDEFLNKPYENYKNIEKPFQPLIILVNSVYKELEKYSMKEILCGKRPINYFIEKSYRNKFKVLNLIYN
jgi:mannosyltransferase OCH1-like enzyme